MAELDLLRLDDDSSLYVYLLASSIIHMELMGSTRAEKQGFARLLYIGGMKAQTDIGA